MLPTGEQLERLQNALLDAYTFEDLRMMVRLGLDAELEHIVPILDRNLSQIVFSLIRWAASQVGGLVRLSQAALASNPDNPQLRAWAVDYAHIAFDVLPLPGAESVSDSASRPIALPFETILVPAGPFLMGSIAGNGIPAHETPQFELVLGAYRIGKYPVTNEQYAGFVRESRMLVGPDLGWDGQVVPYARLRHPVSGVTWYEALAYCRWLSDKTGAHCTLPTEAQWEKAARGMGGRLYPWGNAWEDGRSNHGNTDTARVDACPPQSPYGCCDMVGNVRQWTLSLWGERLQAPDPANAYPWTEDVMPPEASEIARRIWRGGSYADPKEQLRCAMRGALFPTRTGPPGLRMGMRVVAAS